MARTKHLTLDEAKDERAKIRRTAIELRDFEAAAGSLDDLMGRALAAAVAEAPDWKKICRVALSVQRLGFPRWG